MLTLQVVGPARRCRGQSQRNLLAIPSVVEVECTSGFGVFALVDKPAWAYIYGKGPKNPVFRAQQPKVHHPTPDWGRAEGPEVGSRARPLSQLEQWQMGMHHDDASANAKVH